MSNKPKRNEPCPCGSGIKYKYCCISKELKERKVPIVNCQCPKCGQLIYVDYTNDWLNHLAALNIPLMNFCKDNGFYFFGMHLHIGEIADFQEKIKKGLLTIDDIMNAYKRNFGKEQIFGLLDSAIHEQEIFKKREKHLKDALEAHFDGKYTLSVPVFFAQLEGLLRDIGKLENKDSVRPTIPTTNWNERFAFSIQDHSEYFNAFITKLFEGGKSSAFNRNPILHGFGLDYHTEENSMILFMSILELRTFLWFDKALDDLLKEKK